MVLDSRGKGEESGVARRKPIPWPWAGPSWPSVYHSDSISFPYRRAYLPVVAGLFFAGFFLDFLWRPLELRKSFAEPPPASQLCIWQSKKLIRTEMAIAGGSVRGWPGFPLHTHALSHTHNRTRILVAGSWFLDTGAANWQNGSPAPIPLPGKKKIAGKINWSFENQKSELVTKAKSETMQLSCLGRTETIFGFIFWAVPGAHHQYETGDMHNRADGHHWAAFMRCVALVGNPVQTGISKCHDWIWGLGCCFRCFRFVDGGWQR